MRPSQYHYIKRMWTRNMYSRKRGLLAELFLFPIKVVLLIILSCFYIVLGLPYLIIKFLGNLLKKHETIPSNAMGEKKDTINVSYKRPETELNQELDVFTIEKNEVYNKIRQTKTLANIINTTCDFDEFVNSFERLITKLEYLSSYEERPWFVNSTPSKDLVRILNNKTITEKEFIDRHIDKYGIQSLESKKQYLYFFSVDSITYFNSKLKHD